MIMEQAVMPMDTTKSNKLMNNGTSSYAYGHYQNKIN